MNSGVTAISMGVQLFDAEIFPRCFRDLFKIIFFFSGRTHFKISLLLSKARKLKLLDLEIVVAADHAQNATFAEKDAAVFRQVEFAG